MRVGNTNRAKQAYRSAEEAGLDDQILHPLEREDFRRLNEQLGAGN